LLWLGLIVLLLLLLRKARPVWRYAVLGSLIAVPAGLLLAFTLSTVSSTSEARIARSPISLGGATFPAGSEVEYRPSQDGQQPDTLFRARSKTPVQLGNLEILELELGQTGSDDMQVALSREQVIEGWTCSAAYNSYAELSRSQPDRLINCSLGAPRMLGSVTWPPHSYVTRDRRHGAEWHISWQPDIRGATIPAFGTQVGFMSASYDANLTLMHLLFTTQDSQYECESDIEACLARFQAARNTVNLHPSNPGNR